MCQYSRRVKTVRFTKAAVKALRSMPKQHAELIRAKIDQFAADPESLANNVKRLQGRPGLRLRAGDYRVIFTEDGTVLDVLAIGHRREVYQ
jgi:mRNA interferase RelE/StbE